MTYLVFVPGIQGVELYEQKPAPGQCARVWPPRLLACPHRAPVPVSWLARKTLRAGQPIDVIDGCVEIYQPLDAITEAAGFVDASQSSAAHRRLAYGYDWRANLWDVANSLANLLDTVKFHPDEELVLLAHSMGGLICRLLLESGEFKGRPWFRRIKRFYGVSTPHLGSLEILAKHLRLHTIAGVDGDPGVIFSDPAFSSGYQLLPPPARFAPGQRPLVLDRTGRALDIYSAAGAETLGLKHELLEAARFTWSKLDLRKRPTTVRYKSFTGGRIATVHEIAASSGGRWTRTLTNDGDGAVPDWSLTHTDDGIDVRRFAGEHLQVLAGAAFAQALGEELSVREIGAFTLPAARQKRMRRIEIQTNSSGYAPLQPVAIAVFLHGAAPQGVDIAIDIERIEAAADSNEANPNFAFQAVSGARVQLHDELRLTLPAPEATGAYRLALTIKGALVAVSSPFMVSAAHDDGDADAAPRAPQDAGEAKQKRPSPAKRRRQSKR